MEWVGKEWTRLLWFKTWHTNSFFGLSLKFGKLLLQLQFAIAWLAPPLCVMFDVLGSSSWLWTSPSTGSLLNVSCICLFPVLQETCRPRKLNLCCYMLYPVRVRSADNEQSLILAKLLPHNPFTRAAKPEKKSSLPAVKPVQQSTEEKNIISWFRFLIFCLLPFVLVATKEHSS